MSRIWKTADGRKIPIDQLTDQHLRNIKALLDKHGFMPSKAYFGMLHYLASGPPDGAGMAVEATIEGAKISDMTDAIFAEYEQRFGMYHD